MTDAPVTAETDAPAPPAIPAGACVPDAWRAPLDRVAVIDGPLERAAQHPDRTALRDGDAVWTYRELFAAASAVRDALAEHGVAPGEAVLILAPHGAHSAVAVFGAMLAGTPYACIDTHSAPAFAVGAARRIHARCILLAAPAPAFDATLAELDPEGAHTLTVTEVLAARAEPARLPAPGEAPCRGEAIADYAPTSGTTGDPKILADSHRYKVDVFRRWIAWYGYGPHDTIGVQSTFLHDAMFDIASGLAAGASATMLPDQGYFDGPTWFDRLRRERVTSLMLVPSAFRVALEALNGPPLLPSLRRLILMGDFISGHLVKLLAERVPAHVAIHNCYGFAEALFVVSRRIEGLDAAAANSFDFDRHAAMPCDFEPWRGDMATGAMKDRLRTSGPGKFSGYLDANGRIAEPIGHVWPTTDVFGRPGPNGRRYLGRIDRSFVLCGHRIDPDEIEQAMLLVPSVTSAKCEVDTMREEIMCQYYSQADFRRDALVSQIDIRILKFCNPVKLALCSKSKLR